VYEGALGERSDLILGHESVGKIAKVGSEVKDFKPGDKVIVPAITPEWRTVAVQEGVPACHSQWPLTGWKFSNIKDGVFADVFHVNDADMNLALMPEGMSYEQAVMMPDMVTTGIHGAELADIAIGATVVVIGIGPVGLMSVAGAKLRGAARILAVGNRPKTVELARHYGATEIINYKQGDIVQQVLDATGGVGADNVIIAGGPSEVLAQAVDMLKAGGTIGNVNYFGSGDTLPIPRVGWAFGMGHKTIRGGLTPGGRARMQRMAALAMHKLFDPGLMVTQVFKGLDKIPEALELMHHKSNEVIKPIVLV
jgi:threonine dehydrogenase-like Zn-dependent dehydrogenase